MNTTNEQPPATEVIEASPPVNPLPDRVTLLYRHYWNEIGRLQAELKVIQQKLALLDEVEEDAKKLGL